jgi:hypothetical protein
MTDQLSDWQFVVLKGDEAWVDGVKKRNDETVQIIKAAIQAWDRKAEEGRGYLEKRDGEFVFHPEVDWRD